MDPEKEVALREQQAMAAVNEAQAHMQAAVASLRKMAANGDEAQKKQARTLLARLEAVALESTATLNERLTHARLAALRARAGIAEAALAAQAAAMAELRQVAMAKLQIEADRQQAQHSEPAPAPRPQPRPVLSDATVWKNEERNNPRISLQTIIDYASESNIYTGFTTDLSEGGVFIATVDQLDIGTRVDVAFTLPTGQIIHTLGEVRWLRPYDDHQPQNFPGMGIRFLNLSHSDTVVLHQFVQDREPMFYPD